MATVRSGFILHNTLEHAPDGRWISHDPISGLTCEAETRDDAQQGLFRMLSEYWASLSKAELDEYHAQCVPYSFVDENA